MSLNYHYDLFLKYTNIYSSIFSIHNEMVFIKHIVFFVLNSNNIIKSNIKISKFGHRKLIGQEISNIRENFKFHSSTFEYTVSITSFLSTEKRDGCKNNWNMY